MAVESVTKEKSSSLQEFESLLNDDFKDRKLKENEVIKAVVTEITKNFIVVDCKAKMEGMIPIEEFKDDNELEKLKVGSKIEVYLERIESFKGEIVISREKARRLNAWKKLEKVFETGEEITAYITGRVKGGFIATCDGLPTFMPSSQIDVRPLKKIDHLMNVPLKVIATRIDKIRGNVCTSRRAVLEKSKNAEVKEILKNLKEGDIINDAKVKATTDWGIFLDIHGIDALLHVSDLSHGRVKKPADMVTIGQSMKVKITKIDPETNRVSASVKALTVDPYDNLEKKYEIGKIYDGTVTKIVDYGAFVKLQEGLEGLVHQSSLSWTKKNVHPSKILSSSQKIKVKVIELDTEKRRISLSYKDTLENPWTAFTKKYQVGSIVNTKIKNIADFALFVSIENSEFDGMIHYKDISWQETEESLKKYKKNDSVKAKLLEIDLEKEKIRLGIKQLDKDPFDFFLKKENKEIITATVHEVLKNGIRVSVGNDKNLILTIKKNQLAKEIEDCRPEIFTKGNKVDCMIVDLDKEKRNASLSIKELEKHNEKVAIEKYGKDGSSSGAVLGDILGKVFKSKKKKEKK